MNNTLSPTPTNSSTVTGKKKPSRLHFVDHMRVFMAILVVLHHIALVYGASLKGYYYVEPPSTNPKAFQWLLVFVMVNQSWFMGAFFLLAGYFIRGSYDRKGAGGFIKDKLLHLGIPIILYSLVLNPIAFIGYYLMPSELTGITGALTWERFWQAYPYFTGLGPLWFVAMLLVFSLGYMAWRLIFKKQNSEAQKSSSPGYLAIGIFILVLAVVSYFFRMVVPIGKAVWQFPSLGYLPQYLIFFMVGIVAYRNNWFRNLSTGKGIFGAVLASAAGIFLFPFAFSGKMFSVEVTPTMEIAFGNGTWQSGVYALWDSLFAVGLFLALLVLFRGVFNHENKVGKFLTKQSYAVYLIHIPIVVFLAYFLRDLEMNTFLKFGLASVIIVPICFIVAFIVRNIPGLSKIL
ncbi:MAG: acyltransferase family protein [Anaerolineaceae bacterium]|nr:acyltransferase family protein [Anaerolineaceae bacterium]